MYMHICMYMYVYIYCLCIYLNMCLYMYMCIYIYIYLHAMPDRKPESMSDSDRMTEYMPDRMANGRICAR